jgi:hypothetical protein
VHAALLATSATTNAPSDADSAFTNSKIRPVTLPEAMDTMTVVVSGAESATANITHDKIAASLSFTT